MRELEPMAKFHVSIAVSIGYMNIFHRKYTIRGNRNRNLFSFLFYFLNYDSMITHLQETWKIQNKITYIGSSTVYYNYF